MDSKTANADPKNAPSNEMIAGELKEMRHSLEQMQRDLANKQDCAKKEKGSRTALTVTFGILGAKILAVIGFKIGAIRHLIKRVI